MTWNRLYPHKLSCGIFCLIICLQSSKVTALDPPANLSFASVAETQFTFTWTPVPGLTYSYHAVSGTTGNNDATTALPANDTGTQIISKTTAATPVNISPNTQYSVTLFASNSSETSGPAAILVTTISTAPTPLTLESNDTSVTATWTAPTGDGTISNYSVAWNGGTTETVTSLSASKSGLGAGKFVTVAVSANNAGGKSAWTTNTTFTNPSQPTALSLSSTNLIITVNWGATAAGETVTKYLVGWDPNDGETPNPKEVANTTTQTSISGLTSGQTYTVSLTARNAGGNSLSATATITTTVDAGLVAGLTIMCVAIIIILIVGFIYYKKRESMKKKEIGPTDNGAVFMEPTRAASRVIMISDFDDLMIKMRENSGFKFSEEYEELKSVGCEQSSNIAQLPENRNKNRFSNILPYDITRVKLDAVSDQPGVDYINANYVPGNNNRQREYIATQGPLSGTKDDFWRMVWEQNTRNIVMMVQTVEEGKIKCDHYWPFENIPIAVGGLTLLMTSEAILPHWTIREFNLTYGQETRRIRHFHYTDWPAHGVPDTAETLVKFIRHVRRTIDNEANHTGPTVVHCSGGTGRTGTFIAMDRLLQHLTNNSSVDIFGIVHQMHMHRIFMIQTESQYILIHQMIHDLRNNVYGDDADFNIHVYNTINDPVYVDIEDCDTTIPKTVE